MGAEEGLFRDESRTGSPRTSQPAYRIRSILRASTQVLERHLGRVKGVPGASSYVVERYLGRIHGVPCTSPYIAERHLDCVEGILGTASNQSRRFRPRVDAFVL